MADRTDPKIPANLEAAVKALANVPKIEALTVPMIPPGMEAIVKALNNVPRIEAFKVPQVDLSAFTKLQNDALTAFPAWQRQLTQQLRPIADLQRHLQQISLPSQAVIEQFTEAARRLRFSFEHLVPSPEQLKLFERIAEVDRHKRALDRIGVLPHLSMPFTLLDNQNDEQSRAALQKHYSENWSEISAKIRKRVQALDLDDEAKAVMAEALEAHGNSHYRSVCRLLLPEIERVARVELEGNRAGTVYVHTVIGKPAESLPLSSTNLPAYLALGLYERLTDHLYIKVDDTNRAQMEQDPVPNRHAAIHGLIVYRSFWNSLNVIFMTDYAFQLVSAIKEAQQRAGDP